MSAIFLLSDNVKYTAHIVFEGANIGT